MKWFIGTMIPTTLTILGALAACDRTVLSGPPVLKLGRVECGECGMLINEDRCSSALLIENDGQREHVLYDDIGCMLDAEREGLDGRTIIERYVHDHSRAAWISEGSATFLVTDPKAILTPMGSGIVAFDSREAASKVQNEHGGNLLTYVELITVRKTFMEERYGKPKTRDD